MSDVLGSPHGDSAESGFIDAPSEHVHPDAEDAASSARTQEALREIRGLTSRLIESSRASLFRAEEDRAMQSALQELRTVSREIGGALSAELRRESSLGTPQTEPRHGCGCSPSCEGAPPGCCCFEIVLVRARVIEDQTAPDLADAGAGNALELIFNVLADGQGEVYPSLVSHIAIEKKQKWVSINKVIRKLCLPCGGGPRNVPLTVEIMEIETLAAGGRPEFGSNSGWITLQCGCQAPTVPISVELTGGGVTGGEVMVEISARQI
jgi:hypothetical protein